MNQADLIDQQLRALVGRPLDQAAAVQVVDLHGKLTRALADSYTGGVWLTSFVSKYLHFHCCVVPFYDSRAVARIGGFVNRRDARRARHNLSKPPDGDPSYYDFVAKFLALWRQIITEAGLAATVKEVDYLLVG